MWVKKTVFWVRSPQTGRPLQHSTISPVQLPAVTRFHPLVSHHFHHRHCQQPQPQRPQARFLLLTVSPWLLCRRNRRRSWTLLLLRLVVQLIRVLQGITLLLPTILWPRHRRRCSRRVSTRIATPPPAAEPVPIFQLQKSYRPHTQPNTILTLSALRHRLSHCRDPPSQR